MIFLIFFNCLFLSYALPQFLSLLLMSFCLFVCFILGVASVAERLCSGSFQLFGYVSLKMRSVSSFCALISFRFETNTLAVDFVSDFIMNSLEKGSVQHTETSLVIQSPRLSTHRFIGCNTQSYRPKKKLTLVCMRIKTQDQLISNGVFIRAPPCLSLSLQTFPQLV